MKEETLIVRVDTLIKSIDTAINDVGTKSLEEFGESDLLVRGTCFCLIQIGEQMNNLERKLSKDYPDTPWDKAVALRNLIVHVYNKVKIEPIYWTVINDLPLLRQTFSKIRKNLLEKSRQ